MITPINTKRAGAFVAYYRVSTVRQGESGLGLEAQRVAVARYLAGVTGSALVGEFTEVESGKKSSNRPQLAAAMAACRRERATLLIAKLDRLARNVHFISGLMESAADFVAVDMPSANKLTLHIMASMAEHEREMISARTKAGLAEVKREIERDGSRTARVGRPARNWEIRGGVSPSRKLAMPADLPLKSHGRCSGLCASIKAKGKAYASPPWLSTRWGFERQAARIGTQARLDSCWWRQPDVCTDTSRRK